MFNQAKSIINKKMKKVKLFPDMQQNIWLIEELDVTTAIEYSVLNVIQTLIISAKPEKNSLNIEVLINVDSVWINSKRSEKVLIQYSWQFVEMMIEKRQ